MLVERDGDHSWSSSGNQLSALLIVAELEQLLDKVVAERICQS